MRRYRALALTLALAALASRAARLQWTRTPPARVPWARAGARLECAALGSPPPVVDWVGEDDQPLATVPGLRHVLSDGSLALAGVRADSVATAVRCRATSGTSALLSRAVIIQPITSAPRAAALLAGGAGGAGVLRCQPVLGDLVWLRDGLPITPSFGPAGFHRAMGAGGVLVVRGEEQRGQFQCSLGGVLSAPVVLQYDAFTWSISVESARQELHSVSAREGDVVVLVCLLGLQHVTQYVWFKAGAEGRSEVFGDERVQAWHEVLVLAGARARDSGVWSCRARAAEHEFNIDVRVAPALVLVIHPNPLVATTGAMEWLNCTGAGGREVSWYREGRRLRAAGARLALGPVRRADAGLYQCAAGAGIESAEASAEVVIGDSTPRLYARFAAQTARSGGAASMRCVAGGAPVPRLHWLLDGRPLSIALTRRYQVSESTDVSGNTVSFLNISSLAAEDGGLYGCNATNAAGSVAHHARLDVYGPPYIRFAPPVHVTADSDITLQCPYSGYPIKEVRWTREGGASAGESVEGGALVVQAARAEHAGGYTCEVRGPDGEIARRTIQLLVHKPPKLSPFIFPDDVERGSSVQATCSAVSGDRPIHFTWLKDGQPVPAALKAEQKNLDFFSIIIMAEVTSAHAGTYTCRASNSVATVELNGQLLVKEPPQWLLKPKNTSALAGTTIIVPCMVKGFPQPHISWQSAAEARGPFAPVEAAAQARALPDGALWLRAGDARAQRWYRCSVGHALSEVVFVAVHEPPTFDRTDTTVTARAGHPASLRCPARGAPELRVLWTRAGRRLAHDLYAELSAPAGFELLVRRVEPSLAGEYRCRAENLYGAAELAFYLVVKERPPPPLEFQVLEVSSRWARVAWRRAPAPAFLLQRRAQPTHHSAEEWEPRDYTAINVTAAELQVYRKGGLATADMEELVVSDLEPATAYMFRLAAVNDVDRSDFTNAIVVKTREEAPSAPPQDVQVRATRQRELQVTWQAPPRAHWHGALLGYWVRWSAPGEAERAAAAREPAHVLRGLAAATRYAVRVAAYNAAAPGPPSAAVYGVTLEGVPEAPPTDITCTPSSSHSLTAHWSPPPPAAQGGALLGFGVQVQALMPTDELAAPAAPELRVPAAPAALRALRPHARYAVRVRAFTAAGDGPLSEAVFCTTLEDVPSPPAGIKLVALGEAALRASWLPPAQPNGRLTHYALYLRDLVSGAKANVTSVPAPEGPTEGPIAGAILRALRGLRPGRTYEAWVRAATAVGEGAPSASVTAQTSHVAPARISSFGGAVRAEAGAPLLLACAAGGVPAPAVRWRARGAALRLRAPLVREGDDLVIQKLDLSLADNYTCIAENAHGSDAVTWSVTALTAPAPPALALLAARAHELRVELRAPPPTANAASALAYRLSYRRAGGEWRGERPTGARHTVRGLRCGTVYELVASAVSARGEGPAGVAISARTAGGPPQPPRDATFVSTNATAAHIDTLSVDANGCPPVHVRVQWRQTTRAWSEPRAAGHDVLVLSPLEPASWHELRVLASNEAGAVTAVFEFATTTEDGDRLAPRGETALLPTSAGEAALLLALCAALSLAALVIALILVRRHRNPPVQLEPVPEKTGGAGTRGHTPCKQASEMSDVYEISPYATFAGGGGGARAYTLQLRAPPRTDDDAAPRRVYCHEETCLGAPPPRVSRGRRRRRSGDSDERSTPAYYPDTGYSQDDGS